MKKYNALLFALTTTILTACGGSGSSTTDTKSTSGNTTPDTTTPDTTKNIGVFTDSPIINIGYRTATLEGVTSELGEYEYMTGENVTFFIGDLEFPTVAGAATVTPLDFAGTTLINNSMVVNIIRLLQSLDKDGDASNGITITDTAKTTAYTAEQIDFTLSELEFESLLEVDVLIRDAGLDTSITSLVTSTDAIAHFQNELIGTEIENDIQKFSTEFLNGTTTYHPSEENGAFCIAEQSYTTTTVSVTIWLYNADGSWTNDCPTDFGVAPTLSYIIDDEGKLVWPEDEWWFVLNSVNDEHLTLTDPDGTYSAYFSKETLNNKLSEGYIPDNEGVDSNPTTLTCDYHTGYDDSADNGLGAPITPNSFDDFIDVVTDCGSTSVITKEDIAGITWLDLDGEKTAFNNDSLATKTSPSTGQWLDSGENAEVTNFNWYIENFGNNSYLIIETNSELDNSLPAGYWYRSTQAISTVTGDIGVSGATYHVIHYNEASNYSDTNRSANSDGEIYNTTYTQE